LFLQLFLELNIYHIGAKLGLRKAGQNSGSPGYWNIQSLDTWYDLAVPPMFDWGFI